MTFTGSIYLAEDSIFVEPEFHDAKMLFKEEMRNISNSAIPVAIVSYFLLFSVYAAYIVGCHYDQNV